MNEAESKKMQQLIARVWADESFKQKFLADPTAILAAEGMPIPAGVTVKALEDTAQVLHLVIPAKPTELSDDDLDNVAAAGAPCPCFCQIF